MFYASDHKRMRKSNGEMATVLQKFPNAHAKMTTKLDKNFLKQSSFLTARPKKHCI